MEGLGEFSGTFFTFALASIRRNNEVQGFGYVTIARCAQWAGTAAHPGGPAVGQGANAEGPKGRWDEKDCAAVRSLVASAGGAGAVRRGTFIHATAPGGGH